jgi:predicted amidohydrolase
MVKLGLGQLLVEGGEPWRNIERATKLVASAADAGCNIILLPETIDFAWTHPSALTESLPIPGAFSNYFCELARNKGIYICVGLTERTADGNYNTALLIDNKGEILLKYHKINLLEVEFPYYLVGNILSVVSTPIGKIGVNICADNYADALHIGHTLARMGAQIILSPSSWTVDFHITEVNEPYHDKWFRPFQLLAGMHDIIVASATSVGYIVGGPYEGKKMVGKSLVVDKNGILAEGMFNEFAGELRVVEVALEEHMVQGTQIGRRLKERGYQFDL